MINKCSNIFNVVNFDRLICKNVMAIVDLQKAKERFTCSMLYNAIVYIYDF